MKVSEYKVVTGNPLPVFEEKIKTALTNGWQPLGGVSTLKPRRGFSFLNFEVKRKHRETPTFNKPKL